MDKDRRLYARFTLGFPNHPKILILSDAAFRCLVEATLWSREQEKDGFLARRLALAKWSLAALQELCTNDDENPSLVEREEGWYIHHYAEHQETKADIEARRERNRTNGQKGGLAKAKRGAKRVGKPATSDSVSENVAEKEEEKHNSTTAYAVVERARKRAHRLPDNWLPDETVIKQMSVEHPHVDLRAEHAKFVDYWQAKSGSNATKHDWNATWRNWIRRAAENHTPAPVLRAVGSTVDDKVNGWLELANTPGRELE